MINDDFQSSTLQYYLKNKINQSQHYHYRLRLLVNCCTYADNNAGVQIISNGKDSRIIGPRPCHHAWACPYCTAKKMAKYAKRIAAAIEALEQQNLVPIMITFTIFHTRSQSCEDSFAILRRAWELFDKNGRWTKKRTEQQKNGRKQSNNVSGDNYIRSGAWTNFRHDFNITHSVKCLETTYGKHGWHPHMHALFWVPKDKLQNVAEYEESLLKRWLDCENSAAQKILKPRQYEIRKFLYAKESRPDAEHKALYISKTPDGKIYRVHSGDYACGWAGEHEITGGTQTLKEARGDNMTPFQILQKAYLLEKRDKKQSNHLLRLFMNFAYTVKKNRISRIAFSRTGIKSIIDNFLQSNAGKEYLKKKVSQLNVAAYYNVAWFSKQQWSRLTYINDYCNIPLIPLIIRFATYENGFSLIRELCIVNNLEPPQIQCNCNDYASELNKLLNLSAA